MEFHVGRLLDHVHLRVRDLERSRRFYEAALGALGRELTAGEGFFHSDELFVSADASPTTDLHLAFQAAAIAAGGADNGAPGERAYHPGYFAAYALDPDGNNVEAVYHGPSERSAPSVVVTPTES